MCRIEFQETFRKNVGDPDPSKKSCLRKNVLITKILKFEVSLKKMKICERKV